MSYARQSGDTRSAAVSTATSEKGKPLLAATAAAGDSAYSEEHRRAVEAVKKIQKHVADVQKQTQQLNAPNASVNIAERRRKVQESVKAATAAAQEADALLKGISVESRGISLQEQKLRQAKQQKLTESLNQVSEELQVALKAYERKEEEVQAAAASEAAAMTAAATASRSSVSARIVRGKADARLPLDEPTMVELGEGKVSGAQLKEMDASEAEVDMHGAIINEFTTEVTTLEEDVRSLAHSMRTMATLTNEQGQVLDNIESNMGRAEEQTSGATEQLVQASQTQRTGTKRLWWILLITLVFAIILVIFLIARH